jgi:hypothetical protein
MISRCQMDCRDCPIDSATEETIHFDESACEVIGHIAIWHGQAITESSTPSDIAEMINEEISVGNLPLYPSKVTTKAVSTLLSRISMNI